MLEIIPGNVGIAVNMADKIPALDSSICQAKEFGARELSRRSSTRRFRKINL